MAIGPRSRMNVGSFISIRKLVQATRRAMLWPTVSGLPLMVIAASFSSRFILIHHACLPCLALDVVAHPIVALADEISQDRRGAAHDAVRLEAGDEIRRDDADQPHPRFSSLTRR